MTGLIEGATFAADGAALADVEAAEDRARIERASSAFGSCPLCPRGNCAGHIGMRDVSLNSPGQGKSPGFRKERTQIRAPWGRITERDARKAPHRLRERFALEAKQRRERERAEKSLPYWS